MADYFPVLSRAVAGLPNNTAEARRAVYDRARNAIIRQLKAIEPPLPEEDIARERMQLEEAIRKIEANAGAGQPSAAAKPQAAPTPAPAAAKPGDPKPSDPKPSAPAPARPAPQRPGEEAPKPGALGSPSPKPAAPSRGPQAGPGRPGPAQARPATRPDGRPIVRSAPAAGQAEPKKKSGLLIALGVLAVVAVGAGLFAARGQIASLFGGSTTEVATTAPKDATPAPTDSKPAEPPAPPPGEDKSADRAPQQDAPPAGQEPAQTPSPPEQEVARAPDATTPAPAETPPAPATPAPAPQAEQPASSGALVAQRAVLYEEGPNQQSGEAVNGTVVWRTESVSGGQNQPLETALRGDIDIPGRKLGATVTIRRNLDATLPASHTIEIQFKIPENFPNAGVSNVPGLLMKADEAARGAAVAGLSVRVMSGFFLIGLSNLDTEKSVNEQLLRDRGWIDVPILYDNGRRAVLTLEKGTPGMQAFNDAFNAWRSSAAAANQPAAPR